MIVIERLRNEFVRATELWASCDSCGWRNSVPVLTVTDLAAVTCDLDAREREQAHRANEHHRCQEPR